MDTLTLDTLVPEYFRQKAYARVRIPWTLVFLVGFLSAFGIGADKLWALYHGIPQRLVTDSPWFYIALTMMMIGTQLFLTGFLGDLISRSSQGRNDYQIEEGIRCAK